MTEQRRRRANEKPVIVFDFIEGKTYRITYEEMTRRMEEQRKRGVRMTASGSTPPPDARPEDADGLG